MEPAGLQAPYRAAWLRIFRQFSVAGALRYPVLAAAVASLMGWLPHPSVRLFIVGGLLAAMAARILISCPRCHARWPMGTDDGGQRRPCARCGLRWGQEEEDEPALEPMDPSSF